jgi:hypothetical protein
MTIGYKRRAPDSHGDGGPGFRQCRVQLGSNLRPGVVIGVT